MAADTVTEMPDELTTTAELPFRLRVRAGLRIRGARDAGRWTGVAEGDGAGDRDRGRDPAVVHRPEAVELPRLRRVPRQLGALTLLATLAALVLALAPAAASAQEPVLVTELNKPPAGYRLTAAQVQRIAARDPRSRAELR